MVKVMLTRNHELERERYRKKREAQLAARPADPVAQLSDIDAAYIAGIIDGDGCIYVTAVGPERSRTVYPSVVVAMTHLGVIKWLQERLGAGTIKKHNTSTRRKNPHWKEQFRVQLVGRRAQLLCGKILPYLIVKKEQARLVCEFPIDMRSGPGVKINATHVNEIRYRLRDQINALNH